MLRVGTVEHDDAVDAAETEHEDEVDGGGDKGLQDRRLRRTWGICTRGAGKVYKARYQLYRSQILQVNNYSLELGSIGKLSPRSTHCTPLHRFGIQIRKAGKKNLATTTLEKVKMRSA